jgi:hypothetical protein
MKKTLSKSSNSNQLSTFFDLYASCGCGPCGCSCASGYDAYVAPKYDMSGIEAGYRSALAAHS